MQTNQKNLSVLANRFKVEELKQRIEFDIAMDVDETDTSWKDKPDTTVSVDKTGKVDVKFSWKSA